MQPAQKSNGFKYFEYTLTSVDDCLVVSQNPQIIIDTLQNEYKYRLKDVGPPLRYFAAQIGRYKFNNNKQAWYIKYLQQAFLEIESKWGALNKIFGD
jgi:hypothetical protein